MDTGLFWDQFRLIDEDEFNKENERTRIEDGDVLLTIVGTIGRSCVVRNITRRFTLQRSVAVFGSNKIVPEFLSLQFKSPEMQVYLERNSKGAAQKGIYLKQLKNIYIAVPPFDEQKRIVGKLESLLSRIEKTIDSLQLSIELKNSLMQSSLDNAFSHIVSRRKVEDLVEVKGGKRLPKEGNLQDDKTAYPYIRVSDFTNKGTIDLSGIKYISQELHEQIKRYVISKDDLYISIAGTIGKTGFVPPELDGSNLTENAAKLVIKDKKTLNLNYLYFFTLTNDFSEQSGLATKVVAQPKLALTRLSKIFIPICPIEEQLQIVNSIEKVKATVHKIQYELETKISYLNELKSSVLDSAFKGQL